MSIALNCPRCNSPLPHNDVEAGAEAVCPSCGQRCQALSPPSPLEKAVEGKLISDPQSRCNRAEVAYRESIGVALWCSITAAWLSYHKKFLHDEELPDEEEKKLLGALIAISTGVEDMAKLGVPADVGRRLVQCYDDLSKE